MDGRRPVAEKALKTPGLPFIGYLEEVICANRLVFLPGRHVVHGCFPGCTATPSRIW